MISFLFFSYRSLKNFRRDHQQKWLSVIIIAQKLLRGTGMTSDLHSCAPWRDFYQPNTHTQTLQPGPTERVDAFERQELRLGLFTDRKLCLYHISFGTWRPVNSSDALQGVSERRCFNLQLQEGLSDQRKWKVGIMTLTGPPGGPGGPRGPSKPRGP